MRFANLYLFSDVRPYEVVRVVSDKCMEVREMSATLDPSWRPEIVLGGFVGHCTNNQTQRYTYESDTTAPVIRMRLRKDGRWHSDYGRHVLADAPRCHYDYNF